MWGPLSDESVPKLLHSFLHKMQLRNQTCVLEWSQEIIDNTLKSHEAQCTKENHFLGWRENLSQTIMNNTEKAQVSRLEPLSDAQCVILFVAFVNSKSNAKHGSKELRGSIFLFKENGFSFVDQAHHLFFIGPWTHGLGMKWIKWCQSL